ncbi:MAG: hypothetical protein ACJ768_22680 [Gaiellaceae bacterium]
MTTVITRTAKSVRSHTLLALLGVFALAAGAAFAAKATKKPDFKIVTSPDSRVITPGAVAKYTVTIKRSNGFKATAMNLSISGLPSGAKATWKTTDGRTLGHPLVKAAAKKKKPNLSVSVLPKSKSATVLTITTAAGKVGTSNPTIKASGGGKSHTKSVKLTTQNPPAPGVTGQQQGDTQGTGTGTGTGTGSGGGGGGGTTNPPPATPSLAVSATPASQNLLQGDVTDYTIDISRSNFTGGVDMSVSGLPAGVTPTWPGGQNGVTGNTVTLELAADSGAPVTTQDFTVTGARSSDPSLTDSGIATVNVQQTHPFDISGNLAPALTPGASVPLDLTLNNTYNFNLKVTALSVSIDGPNTSNGPSCPISGNYTAGQVNSTLLPITVPPGSHTLSSLGIASADMPHISMINDLNNSQDACKSAGLNFTYSGSAGK